MRVLLSFVCCGIVTCEFKALENRTTGIIASKVNIEGKRELIGILLKICQNEDISSVGTIFPIG